MKIIVNNLAIEYEDQGKGKVILFLHGWGDTLHTIDALIPELIKDYRVVRLDLPYFGKSESPKNDWNLDNYLELVEAFIEKLDLKVYAIAGHSFGGRISIKGTALGKFNEEKMILIGSAGLAQRKTFRNSALKLLTKIGGFVTYIPPLFFWREKIRKRIYEILGSDYYNAGPMKETFINVINEELSASVKKITIPTLLIWGEEDTETPLSEGKEINRLIKNSKLEVISAAGHMVHQQKADQVAKLINEFL